MESGDNSAKISPEPVQADDNSLETSNVARKLDGLVIPTLTIDNEYLGEVLYEILPWEFMKADPEGIGVNIVPMLRCPITWEHGSGYAVDGLELNLSLTDATPREVLDIIASKLAPKLLIVGNAVAFAHPLIAEYANVPRFDDLDAQEQKAGEPSKVSQKLDEIVIRTFVVDNETLDDVLNEILPRVFKREDPEGIGIKIVSKISEPRHPEIDLPLLGEELVRVQLHNVTPRDVLNLLALQFFLEIHVTDSEIVVTELPCYQLPCYDGDGAD